MCARQVSGFFETRRVFVERSCNVQGSIAIFGTYSVSETDKTLTIHIEDCTFANWKGTDQKRPFNISGDELNITNPTSSTSTGSNQQVWKRAN